MLRNCLRYIKKTYEADAGAYYCRGYIVQYVARRLGRALRRHSSRPEAMVLVMERRFSHPTYSAYKYCR
jgi:hypothetical protein